MTERDHASGDTHPGAIALLTVGGLGLLRPGPGTWGSLPPVVIAAALATANLSTLTITIVMVTLVVLFSVLCVALTPIGERHFGRKDASQIVADEIVGQAIALLWLPWRGSGEPNAIGWNLMLAGAAFIAFRVFDITKPPPIAQIQRVRGGWGVLLDDLLAGVLALAAVQVVFRTVI